MRFTLIALFIASRCAAKIEPSTGEPLHTPATGEPSAQPSTPPSTQPSATSVPAGASEVPTDDLLDAMEKVGVELKSLRAEVALTESDVTTGNASTRTGKIWLQRRGPGDTRGRVLFDKLDANGRIIAEKIEYLLDGDWVIDRVYGRGANDPAGKRETHRQIRQPGDKTDLLRLGEGPFPLPIGQPRDAVKDQFAVNKLPPDDADKPGLVGLELRPTPGNRLSRQYHSVTVWVDPHDAMPRVIETLDPNAGISRVTRLSDVKINDGVSDEDFVLAPVGEDWTVTTEPLAAEPASK